MRLLRRIRTRQRIRRRLRRQRRTDKPANLGQWPNIAHAGVWIVDPADAAVVNARHLLFLCAIGRRSDDPDFWWQAVERHIRHAAGISETDG
jgi:hypothetical protein